MKLRFGVTVDDLVEFQRHFYTTSEAFRRQKTRLTISFSVVVFAGCLFLNTSMPIESRLVMAAIIILPFPLIIRLAISLGLRFSLRRFLDDGDTGVMIGRRELTADEDGLTETTDVNETRHRWPAITRIDETDSYAYLFIGALQAHVIPKDRIFSGNLDEFLQFAREMVARHATG